MKIRFRMRRAPAWLAVSLLSLLFLLFLGGAWYAFMVLKNSKERDLEKRLMAVGETAATLQINGSEYFLLERSVTPEIFTEDPLDELTSLQSDIQSLRNRAELRSVMIIDDEQRVLISAGSDAERGQVYPLLSLDMEEINQAFSGLPAVTAFYEVENNYHKRGYFPLKSSENQITAVLRLEASQDYFDDLAGVKSALYWLGLVMFILLLFLALVFYKLLSMLIKTEETVAFMDRLRSLGAMAAGLAHEIRNPLGIIRMTAESASEELPPDSEQQPLMKSIVEESDRLDSLMTRFLQFAGAGRKQAAEPVDVAGITSSVISMMKKDLDKKGITLRTFIDDNLPQAIMPPDEFRQVLINLILNSRDVLKKGGIIEISAFRKSRKRVRIEVSDNGPGIPKEIKNKIFDPFFTTRPGGTGLGLFISRMLVEKAGGEMMLISSDDGAAVRIILPASDKKV